MNLQEMRKVNFPICQANKNFHKVFGIGANKTGTTSLQIIFAMIGLNVAPQHEGEVYGVQTMRGNMEPLKKYIDKYDAFQDAPFSVKTVFAQVDALFPNSKFILTHRDAEEWYESLKAFHMKCMNISHIPTKEDIKKWKYIYNSYIEESFEQNWILNVKKNLSTLIDWSLAYEKDFFIQQYQARNETVVRHFSARKNDLLVIDLTKEETTAKIIDFLNLPASLITNMPHANKTRLD
jgi:hypothetical protein